MASFSDASLIDPHNINNKESYAKLNDAKIEFCDFSDALVKKEQLLSAEFIGLITCPDGKRRLRQEIKSIKDEDWEEMLKGVRKRQLAKFVARRKAADAARQLAKNLNP